MRTVVDARRLNAPFERFVDFSTAPGHAWVEAPAHGGGSVGAPDRRRRMLAAAVRVVKAEWHALFCEPPPLFTIDITGLCVLWGAEVPRTTVATPLATTHAATRPQSARGAR